MTRMTYGNRSTLAWLLLFMMSFNVVKGQDKRLGYVELEHKARTAGVIEVTEPGSYGEPGATYMLMNDISSAKSAIFLGKDVMLDLNGYTISYADGDYEHIPNGGFEEGLKGWDISRAPGAKVVNTKEVHTFIGEKLLSLRAGDEIVSEYISLPVAGRSYFAMVGVTGRYYQDMGGDLSKDMKVSVHVEDEQGNDVRVVTEYADTTLVSSPVENKLPRLGGGFVFAHLNNLPAGKYRVRVKAETDCLVDEIDIRPAMDVGIGIVEKTHPMGHYDHLYAIKQSAFFDYTDNVSLGTPLPGIPRIEGKGTVVIRNGVIQSGTMGVMSWGIQSTAENVKIILDNIKIISSGINATAVDIPFATITHSTFDIDNPFLINRHGAEFYAVDLRGPKASEVSFSEFYGGQGCLVIKGNHSSIHNNHFVNRQRVTNHYSVMAMGDSSKIFENRFKPEIGSGISIYRHRGIEIFNNVFHIEASPPTTEYHLFYTTTGVRIADYGAERGSPRGAFGNKVYNNRFYITGKKYREYPDYIPNVSAIYYTASAGDNYIFGNEIMLEQEDTDTDAEAYAFYIGNADGGHFYNNHITANVPPVWIATYYGNASNTQIYRNRFTKFPGTSDDFIPIRIGYSQGNRLAENITFRSNDFENMAFEVNVDDQAPHSYSLSWSLDLHVVDEKENAVKGEVVRILNKNKEEIFRGRTDEKGSMRTELAEYVVNGAEQVFQSPYTVLVGNIEKELMLNKNSEVTYVIK